MIYNKKFTYTRSTPPCNDLFLAISIYSYKHILCWRTPVSNRAAVGKAKRRVQILKRRLCSWLRDKDGAGGEMHMQRRIA